MHHEYSWCIMSTHDASWGPKSGIRFVTKWDAMEVERISTRPISMIFRRASSQISKFSGLHFSSFWISMVFYIILGGTVDHQGLVWGQLGPPGTVLEVFCLSATFPEIPKSWKIDIWVFPVTVFDEIKGNRCGIAARSFSNRPFISKTPDLPPQRPLCYFT